MLASCDSEAYSLRSNQVISARNVQARRRYSWTIRSRGERRRRRSAPASSASRTEAKSSAGRAQHLVGEERVDVVVDAPPRRRGAYSHARGPVELARPARASRPGRTPLGAAAGLEALERGGEALARLGQPGGELGRRGRGPRRAMSACSAGRRVRRVVEQQHDAQERVLLQRRRQQRLADRRDLFAVGRDQRGHGRQDVVERRRRSRRAARGGGRACGTAHPAARPGRAATTSVRNDTISDVAGRSRTMYAHALEAVVHELRHDRSP